MRAPHLISFKTKLDPLQSNKPGASWPEIHNTTTEIAQASCNQRGPTGKMRTYIFYVYNLEVKSIILLLCILKYINNI